jgi:hypothetical protein
MGTASSFPWCSFGWQLRFQTEILHRTLQQNIDIPVFSLDNPVRKKYKCTELGGKVIARLSSSSAAVNVQGGSQLLPSHNFIFRPSEIDSFLL